MGIVLGDATSGVSPHKDGLYIDAFWTLFFVEPGDLSKYLYLHVFAFSFWSKVYEFMSCINWRSPWESGLFRIGRANHKID